jgi:hypothetical protein
MTITFLACDHYRLSSLLDEDSFYAQHLFLEPDGHASIEQITFDPQQHPGPFISILFGATAKLPKLYHTEELLVLEAYSHWKNVITFKKLESLFPDRIEISKRSNTMDEYGLWISIIGYISRHSSKSNLLIRVKLKA